MNFGIFIMIPNWVLVHPWTRIFTGRNMLYYSTKFNFTSFSPIIIRVETLKRTMILIQDSFVYCLLQQLIYLTGKNYHKVLISRLMSLQTLDMFPPTSTTNPIPERPLTPSIQNPQQNTLKNWRAPHDTESFNTKPSLQKYLLKQCHSEPAPMNAPVGCSVHGTGCIFSLNSGPCINPYCTTVNPFWLLTFDLYFFGAIFLPTLTYIGPFHISTLLTKLPC